MRKVTITRKKYFAAAWSKIVVYASTTKMDFPVIIKGTHQFLGCLKNGKSISCEIPDGEITVMAGYDNLGICTMTDFVHIPSGTEDVVLCVKTRLNPPMGNPFYFEKDN